MSKSSLSIKDTIKKIYYVFLELLVGGRGIKRVINKVPVVFPTRYYKYYESDYEKESFAFIKQMVKPGNTILDIGAHIGLYTVAFAKLVGPTGKVFSFEPTPVTNKILRKTVALNGLEQIVTVQSEAISKVEGETEFYISDLNADNSNSLIDYGKPNNVRGVKVSLISIDKFTEKLKRKVDFIKIDVEGVELDAIIGARETFLRDRPLCILALHPNQIKRKGDSLEKIWDVAIGFGYELLYNGKKIDKQFFCTQTTLFDVWLHPMS